MKDDNYKRESDDLRMVAFGALAIAGGVLWNRILSEFGPVEWTLLGLAVGLIALSSGLVYLEFFSKLAKRRAEKQSIVEKLPTSIGKASQNALRLGFEFDHGYPVYLSDRQRRSHVHVLGATGSGKTESVILPLIHGDAARGYPVIILDAKGDHVFEHFLRANVDPEKLHIFDLDSEASNPFNPVGFAPHATAAERFHECLSWSEPFYRDRAKAILVSLFAAHAAQCSGRNPSVAWLAEHLASENLLRDALASVGDEEVPKPDQIAGLKDQVNALRSGHLTKLLSPGHEEAQIRLAEAVEKGHVVYFKLQSLISPQTARSIALMVISNIAYIAGTYHRKGGITDGLCSVFIDEFANFVCPEFLRLISMSRSAGFALHFSHQSLGDLKDISAGYISQIIDNAGTKVVLRAPDPDTAEYMARVFGTRATEKFTYQTEHDGSQIEKSGRGTLREVREFLAGPDLLRNLPRGEALVQIAHGERTDKGGAHLFHVKFPKLRLTEQGRIIT